MAVLFAPMNRSRRWRAKTALHLCLRSCTRFFSTVILVAVVVHLVAPNVVYAANEPNDGKLGIGVFIGPGEDQNGDGLEKTNRLWFALDPGSSSTRPITISSTSSITQTITLGTIAGARENGGALRQQPDREDPIASWVSFSPKEFDLAPGKSRNVLMSISVPNNANTSVNENYVSVRARKTAISTAQYRIPTAIQFVQQMMVTVGNAEDLKLDFNIVDVEGFKGDQGPSLRIYFDNNGGVPVSLAGSTQLSSLDFDGVRSEQYSFQSNVILPGDSGYADVLVNDPVSAGRWRVFVSAYQGSTEKTATFERDLTFDGPPRGAQRPFTLDFQKLLVLLIALGLLIAGIRVMKSGQGQTKDHDLEVDNTENSGSVSMDEAQLAREFIDRITVLKGTLASKFVTVRMKLQQLAEDNNKQVADNTEEVKADRGEAQETESANAVSGAIVESPQKVDEEPEPVVSVEPEDKKKETSDSSKEKTSFRASANALRELKKLLDEGVISQKEFERKRNEILKRF